MLNPLSEAIERKHYTSIKLLNPNNKSPFNVPDAVNLRDMALLKQLIRDKADIDAKDQGGNTALALAIRDNKMEFIKFLLQNKANPNTYSTLGYPMSINLQFHYDIEVVKILLKYGADVNAEDKSGTPLVHASWCATLSVWNNMIPDNIARESEVVCSEIIDFLLEKNASVNVKSKRVVTPLMLSCLAKDNRLFNIFLEKGAKVNAQDDSGRTVLMYAADNSRSDKIQELIKRGAKVKIQDDDGKTALMYLTGDKTVESAQILLDNGVSFNLKDKRGQTALDYAKKNKDEKLVKFLESRGAK